jgi:hypothetical protein
MWSRRDEIDYSLDRRSTLQALFRGSSSAMDACDADPYLRRAARHHGDVTTRDCPICKKKEIRDLRYTFGDELGQYSGRIKSIPELEEMENEFGEFRVYTVEVCLDCGWNHLIYSYLLGDGRTRKAPRKVHTLEDDDWKGPKELKSWHLHEASLRGNRRR